MVALLKTTSNDNSPQRELRASLLRVIPLKMASLPEWIGYWRKVNSAEWISSFEDRFSPNATQAAMRFQLLASRPYYLGAILSDDWTVLDPILRSELTAEEVNLASNFILGYRSKVAKENALKIFFSLLQDFKSRESYRSYLHGLTLEDYMQVRLSYLLDKRDRHLSYSEI